MKQEIKKNNIKFNIDNEVAFPDKEKRTLSMGDFMTKIHNLNPNPPYQRGEVWSVRDQSKLIISILQKLPIGSMHWAKTGKKFPEFNILDSKQRTKAIEDFVKNKFSVTLLFNDEVKNIKYSHLDENEEYLELLQNWEAMSFDVTVWDQCKFSTQKAIFETINHSSNLSSEEKIYCSNYFCAQLIELIYKECEFENIFTFESIGKGFKRFRLHRSIHSMLITCFGSNLMDVFALRPASQGELIKSAKTIDNYLMDHIEEGEIFDKQLLKKLNLNHIIEYVRPAVRWIVRVLDQTQYKDKKKLLAYNFIMDIISILVKKQLNQIINNKFMISDLNNFTQLDNFIVKWHLHKHDGSNRHIRGTAQLKDMQKKFDKMEEIFLEAGFNNDLHIEIKPNNNDIFQAAALSKGVCSKTGLKLTSNNSQVHHIGGDGTTDKENVKFELISDIANGMLSNFSDKVIKNR